MNIFRRIKFKMFPQLISSNEYIQYLKQKGISVGKGTYFFGPANTVIDVQRPWMLEIGEYCKITAGVVILCHDYSRSVLRKAYGEIIGEAGKTIIGDNVFIGTNSIILMGSHIGNNTIIGAGSVVSGAIPDNSVCCGNPAKVIRTLDEHYTIRKTQTKNEAKEWVHEFQNHYGRFPLESEMGPFWQLFMPRDFCIIKEKNINLTLNGDDAKEMMDFFLLSKQEFASFDDFIKWCQTPENEDFQC